MQPGMRVGSYELVRELGRGGMGVVYAARHVELKRDVALKVMLGGHAPDDAAVQRFGTETEALARFNHPNVVRVHDAGWHGQHRFMVMELLEEVRSLKERLALEGPLDIDEAASLIETVARAIQHAHEGGILHRDLKPDNILIDSTGRPLVTDFGLARDTSAKDHLTRTGEVLGTPSFMPPEQADGDVHNIDARADVYSLGATLYALLTGHPPFRGGSVLETLSAVLSKPPAPPSKERPDLDPQLEAIVLRCLEKDPAARYPSAGALAEALASYVRGDASPAGPSSGLVGLLAVVAVLAAVVLGLAVRSTRSGRQAEPASAREREAPAKTAVPEPEAPAAAPLAWVERPRVGDWPEPRDLSPLAWDPHRGVAWMFGGRRHDWAYLGDLWSWDGARWTQRKAQRPWPGHRKGHAMTFDVARRRLVVLGGEAPKKKDQRVARGDTWEWDGSRWHARDHRATLRRMYGRLAYHRDQRVVLLFGGYNPEGKRLLNDLWEWNGKGWRELESRQRPPPRFACAMAYDSQRGRLVVFGGIGPSRTATCQDMWEWDGDTWREVDQGPTTPGPRAYARLVDTGAGLLMVGGYSYDGKTEARRYFHDVWLWEGKVGRWRPLPVSNRPVATGVGLYGLTWLPERRTCLLFGGKTEIGGKRRLFDRLWELGPIR